jgi:ureidoglycolate hydrolase
MENSLIPTVTLRAEELTPEAFAPFGMVLRRDPLGEPFQALLTEPDSQGWRVALLDVEAGPFRQIHRHPDSDECFAPLSGKPFLAVAPSDNQNAIRVFPLTEPVCVRRNVWHQMAATVTARIFIAENAILSGEVHPFDSERFFEA